MSGESESMAASAKAGAPDDGPKRVRLDWVDALKGIGIIAVVAGHVWMRGPVRDAIYLFHMPLFFMLSGALTTGAMPTHALVPRLLRGLGLPFLSFSVLLLGADVLIEGLRGVRPIFPSPWAGVSTILFATEKLRGPFAILWFVPSLFFARILWNVLLKAGGSAQARRLIPVMAGVALIALLADLYMTHSPLGLLPVPAALLLLWLGALWRDWRAPRLLAIGLALFALAALILFPPLNMRAGDLGWPLLSLAGAVAVVDRLGGLSRLLPGWAVAFFSRFGRATLVIMYVHIAFIHYLAPYAPPVVLFGVALAGSLAVDGLARLTAPGRLLLLGERSPRPSIAPA